MASDVDVGLADEALAAGALLRLRLVHEDDEVLQGIGNEEGEGRVVHQKLGRIHLQRTNIASHQRQVLVLGRVSVCVWGREGWTRESRERERDRQ